MTARSEYLEPDHLPFVKVLINPLPIEAGNRLLTSYRTGGHRLVDQAACCSPPKLFVGCRARNGGLEVGTREEQNHLRLGCIAGVGIVRVVAAAN